MITLDITDVSNCYRARSQEVGATAFMVSIGLRVENGKTNRPGFKK